MIRKDDDYLNLFRDFPDGLFQTDLNGNYTMVNHLYAEIFGYEMSEMLSGTFNLRKTWVIEDEVRLLLSEVQRKAIKGIVIKFRNKKGELGRIELSIGAKRDEIGNLLGYEGRARDITKRYAAQVAEVEARQNAEFLIDLMAHDLNNIHQGMLMPLEYILSDPVYPVVYRKPLELAIAQLQYATDLIKNVKRLQMVLEMSDAVDSFNLSKAIEEASLIASRAFPQKNMVLNQKFSTDSFHVIADSMLVDLFFNLFHNSMKHDPSEEVHIDIETYPSTDEDYIEVHVKDYGPGVPDEEKTRILQRRMGAKGTGIGLTIINYLLDKYEGTIRVTDRVEGDQSHGSNFIIEFKKGEIA